MIKEQLLLQQESNSLLLLASSSPSHSDDKVRHPASSESKDLAFSVALQSSFLKDGLLVPIAAPTLVQSLGSATSSAVHLWTNYMGTIFDMLSGDFGSLLEIFFQFPESLQVFLRWIKAYRGTGCSTGVVLRSTRQKVGSVCAAPRQTDSVEGVRGDGLEFCFLAHVAAHDDE